MKRPSKRLSRRTIGTTMIAVGVAGIVVSITSVIVGQSLIAQVRTSVDDSLQLTNEALSAVTDSIAVTKSTVDTVRTGMDSIETTLDTVGESLDGTTTAIDDSADFLGGSLPDALDAVNGVLPNIESVASSIDDALRVLERAPFGPDYNPVQPFDEAIGELSTAIGPLPEQLRTLSTDFAGLSESTGSISGQISVLADDIADLDTQLSEVSTLLDRYAATTADAQRLATDSRADLSDSARSTRILLWLLGAVFAAGQIVPIWLGIVLLGDGGVQSIVTRRHDPDGHADGQTAVRAG